MDLVSLLNIEWDQPEPSFPGVLTESGEVGEGIRTSSGGYEPTEFWDSGFPQSTNLTLVSDAYTLPASSYPSPSIPLLTQSQVKEYSFPASLLSPTPVTIKSEAAHQRTPVALLPVVQPANQRAPTLSHTPALSPVPQTPGSRGITAPHPTLSPSLAESNVFVKRDEKGSMKHGDARLILTQQPEPSAILVKKTTVEYVVEFHGLDREKLNQNPSFTVQAWFWVDSSQKWEMKDGVMHVSSIRKIEKNVMKVIFQIKYDKTSKMLPVFVRFSTTVNGLGSFAVDSSNIILIGREDLQKTRAEGILFWMEVAGGMENEVFKAKYPWSTVESVLKQHFAKEMKFSGRAFDEKEILYIKERTKLANSDQINKDTFLQIFWPWFYPVEQNIVKYKQLWNEGLIHGFFQKDESERMVKNSPKGTFVLRFCSNSNFEPHGAFAVTVSKDPGVPPEHILLSSESLEKESLYKLLGRYTDCVYFCPNYPKIAIEEIRREMDESPGLAHYKDVGFSTSTSGVAANPPPISVSILSPSLPPPSSSPQSSLKRKFEDDLNSREDNPALKRIAPGPGSPAVNPTTPTASDPSGLPTTVLVRHRFSSGEDKAQKFHLSEGLNFRQLIPNAIKLFKLDGTPDSFGFQDSEGVSYPDDAVVQTTCKGAVAPEVHLVRLE